jgi:hypothetical protein
VSGVKSRSQGSGVKKQGARKNCGFKDAKSATEVSFTNAKFEIVLSDSHPSGGFPVSWSQQVIHEISGLTLRHATSADKRAMINDYLTDEVPCASLA